MQCTDADRALRAHFVEPSARTLARVRPHLATCPRCRRLADRLLGAEAALAGSYLAPGEKDALWRAVESRPARGRGRWLGLAALAGVGATAALMVGLWVRAPGEFAARGGHAVVPAAGLVLRPLCLSEHGAGLQARPALGADGRLTCFAGERIGLTCRNLTAASWRLQAALVDEGGAVHAWLTQGAPLIPPGDDAQPVELDDTSPPPPPGRFRLVGVFTPGDAPLEPSADRLRGGAAGAQSVEMLIEVTERAP